MATKQTSTHIQTTQGQLQQHEVVSDATALPIASYEKLHQFRPDLVDVAIEQTIKEAEHRRKQTARVNLFQFIPVVMAQTCAFLLGLSGLGIGAWLASIGQAWAGVTIACACIGGLAVAFVSGNSKNRDGNSESKLDA